MSVRLNLGVIRFLTNAYYSYCEFCFHSYSIFPYFIENIHTRGIISFPEILKSDEAVISMRSLITRRHDFFDVDETFARRHDFLRQHGFSAMTH